MNMKKKTSVQPRKKAKELCDFCGGTLYSKIGPLEFRLKGELLVIEGVPAEVCNRCGQKYLSAEAEAGIEQLFKTKPGADKTISVPVFQWSTAEPQLPRAERRP